MFFGVMVLIWGVSNEACVCGFGGAGVFGGLKGLDLSLFSCFDCVGFIFGS